jgi:murein DD-endopeptidase MepM/ murein hydrolase activator NlpD
MNHFKASLITAVITAALTVCLYGPVSVLAFRLTEPRFKCPITVNPSAGIAIRNDPWGDGEFGSKRGNGRTHAGIDIQAPVGTPVMASKSGLAFCLNVPTGYGKYILIYHPDGMTTLYSHLSEWNIKTARRVRRGDVIGFVGKTGNARSKLIEPHLHFEIRKDNEPQDPRKLMGGIRIWRYA